MKLSGHVTREKRELECAVTSGFVSWKEREHEVDREKFT